MSIRYNLSPSMSRVHVSLLGHITVVLDNQPLTKVPQQKVAALLTYLLCNPGPHARTQLADLLWDDIPPDRFLPNLRSTLNRLPKAFKPYLVTTRQTIGFEPTDDVWVDVLAFQQLADCLPKPELRGSAHYIILLNEIEERLVQMVDLYSGSFLDGLDIEDAPRFLEWHATQQETLKRLAAAGLRCLVDLAMHRSHYTSGIAYAKCLITLDPNSEEARRQLMIMWAHSGDHQAALKEYQTLVARLNQEQDVSPSPETVAAYKRIAAMSPADESMPSKLPTLVQPLVGREAELATLIDLLQMPDCRLITVTGLGGIGKTYLALETARRVERRVDFLQGVAYVSLAGLQSAERLPEAIVQALELTPAQQGDLLAHVCNYLQSKEMLIVFDNFEHLLDISQREAGYSYANQSQSRSGLDVLAQILQAAPDVKFLVTSRKPLQLQEEYLYPLEGMMLPQAEHLLSLADLMDIDAIRLFQQVALRNNRAFELTEQNRQSVIEFCALVEGTPLAIVLGAAHMDFLTPAELVDECRENLDVLETEWTDFEDRQRSVRAVFEYSWRLLDDSLKLTFQKLTIFHGGFTNQAARQVVGASIPQLRRLYSQSLIKQSVKGRYEIHELLRQFGIEKLAEQPSQPLGKQGTLWNSHMRFYLNWLNQRTKSLGGGKPHEAVAEINLDISNIREAWRQAIEACDIQFLAKGREALALFYETQGLYEEGGDAFKRGVQTLEQNLKSMTQSPTDGESYPHCLEVYSLLLVTQSLFDSRVGYYDQAIEQIERAIGHTCTLDEEHGGRNYIQAFGYGIWGKILLIQGNHQVAYNKSNQALSFAQHISNQQLMANSFYLRGNAQYFLGRYDAAIEDFQQERTICIQTQQRRREIESLYMLGSIKLFLGELMVAKIYFEQGLQISHEINDEVNRHILQYYLCRIAIDMGEYVDAAQKGHKILQFFQNGEDKWMVLSTHYHLGLIYMKLGLYNEAEMHQKQAVQLCREMSTPEKEVKSLVKLGAVYNHLGDSQQALGLLAQAEAIANKLDIDDLQNEVSIHKADVLGQLGQYSESIALYKETFTQRTIKLEHLKIEVMTRLANALMQSGDLPTGLSYIEETISYLEMEPEKIYKFEYPIEVYLNCYRVLNACQDERAGAMLNAGYTLLQTYADRINNPEWRRSFLENVAANREIIRLKTE